MNYRQFVPPSARATAIVAVMLCGACGGDTPGSETAADPAAPAGEVDAVPSHPASTAANAILSCIKEADVAGMRPLLNQANQRMGDDDIAEFLAESNGDLAGVNKIDELRAIPADRGVDGGVWAKLYPGDDEMFVLVLTLEGGKYLFEDINSPGMGDYEAAALVR